MKLPYSLHRGQNAGGTKNPPFLESSPNPLILNFLTDVGSTPTSSRIVEAGRMWCDPSCHQRPDQTGLAGLL